MQRVLRLILVCAMAGVTVGASAAETAPAPVIVTMQSRGRVRVQVSEGLTMPCDSSDNRMLFDATLGPDEQLKTSIKSQCVCVRHTTDSFPRGEWTTSKLVCRPRPWNCAKRVPCNGGDQTIRVKLDARPSDFGWATDAILSAMRKVVAFALFSAGCGLGVVGVTNTNDDAGTAFDAGGADQAAPSPNDASTSVDADAALVDTGPPCDPTPCPGKRCTASGCDYFADCKGLHDAVGSSPSGIYPFRAAGASATFDAYCDMAIAGGGWTLAGQSVADANAADFGFGSSLGDVKVENKAYSINALAQKLAIREILVATGARKSVHTAYIVKPPAGFPDSSLNTSVHVESVTKIVNPDCPNGSDAEPPSGPGMLQFVGFATAKDGFFFRDNKDSGGFGLQRNHWQLNYANCENAGLMNLQQGMVFVR